MNDANSIIGTGDITFMYKYGSAFIKLVNQVTLDHSMRMLQVECLRSWSIPLLIITNN